jgi:hypothetical protein
VRIWLKRKVPFRNSLTHYFRGAKLGADELLKKMPKGDYTETHPVTFYSEHLHNKNYYMSAGTGNNPFAKTSGFTQTIHNTRAAAQFEGISLIIAFFKET